MTLGQTIRYLRQARGLSQAELADQLEISPSYLSLLESDKREASIPLLRQFADRLGAPAFLFFAQALAGTREDPLAKQVDGILDELTHLVASKGLSLGLEPASTDQ